MSIQTRVFPFEPGKSVKITCEKLGRFTAMLNAAGYGCAFLESDFKPGKFVITIDPAHGYTVSWKTLGGLAPVAA